MFTVNENGKQYKVAVRGAYAKTIRSEKKLREVVYKSILAQYGEKATHKPLFELCSILGVLSYSCPVKR